MCARRKSETPTIGEDYLRVLMGYPMDNLVVAPNPKTPNCNINPNGKTDQIPGLDDENHSAPTVTKDRFRPGVGGCPWQHA